MAAIIKVDDLNPYGLDMYREIDEFKAGVRFPGIDIWYYEWLVYPNGTKSPETRKRYSVVDVPAITRKGDPVLITDATYGDDGSGNQIQLTPPVYNYDVPDVIVRAASNGYTNWRRKIIPQEFVGITLGDDIIIASILNDLKTFRWDIENGYIK